MIVGLTILLILVLLLPFSVRMIERNLEFFLFIMGVLAALVSGVLDYSLLTKSLKDPINITIAVLVAGLLFRWLQNPLERGIIKTSESVPFKLFIAGFVIILGLISSVITAIIAAIILVAVVTVLPLERKAQIKLVIIACYSIGIGAVLTPIGEPLSTIATSKLNEEFIYLFKLLARDVIPGVVAFGVLAAILVKPSKKVTESFREGTESYLEIGIRSFKIYVFVMALTLLGAGFEPFIEKYLIDLSPLILYWINMISAVLDNATLAAAEISPSMSGPTIRAILLGLLVSGGMLIPGNIPNIIVAGKLKITSIEWARLGFPIGLLTMLVYFGIILVT